jgi:hypothetical protein
MDNNQKNTVITSLRLITKLLKYCDSEYRILGSILVVAHSGKIFRRIGDVDILIDKKSQNKLFKNLTKNGYKIIRRRWLFFSWFEASKPNCIGLTFLLIGDFQKDYFTYQIMKFISLRINNNYLKSTIYQFGGINFIGIPIKSVVAGIKQSFLNPKRKYDREALGGEMQKEVKVYGNINVYFGNTKVPYLYDIFSFLYNIYGAIRTFIGYKFESW